MLTERAGAGVKVRLCWADPDSQAVDVRDREEGLRGALKHKIRVALTYYQPLLDIPGARSGSTVPWCTHHCSASMTTLLANPHVWGAPASANPILHLRRIEGGTWFDGYRRSFDDVWETALPWDVRTPRTAEHPRRPTIR